MSEYEPRHKHDDCFTELSTEALSYAQGVLSDWGYLNLPTTVPKEVQLTPALVEALTEYDQTWAPSLTFDINNRNRVRDILILLQTRTCGVPDLGHGGIHFTSFGAPGGRWGHGNLTYNINVRGANVSQNFVDGILATAFQRWQAVVPFFTFTQVNGNADIKIKFGDETLDASFGKPGGVAGRGFYPERGDLFLDSKEDWTTFNLLLEVAMHEIGHVLGLSHSTSRSSLMYPYDTSLTDLDAETIEAIQSLYGWQPQIPLNDRGSDNGPSLAEGGAMSLLASQSGGLYMAWKGVPGDVGVYWSRFQGTAWSPQERIPGIGSKHGPALASGFTSTRADGTPVTSLFMAWDGVPRDDGIYYAQNLNPSFFGWSNQQRVDGVGTSDRPALALFDNKMRMAWKGIPGDPAIYWSTFDGNGWSPQQRILGRGTSHGPALVVLGNRLYMFWKGMDNDTRVFSAWIDDQPNAIWQAQREVMYVSADSEGNTPHHIGTSDRPSAVVRGDAIILAWKGVPSDQGLWFAPFRNDELSGQINVPGVGSSAGPTIAFFDALYLAWKGVDGDNGLYYSRLG
jgi:hypothetical protein